MIHQNFGEIKIELLADLSKVTGFYKNIKFEFTDVTIKIFVYDLNNWVKTGSEAELSEMKRVRLRMEIPAASV